LKLAVEDGSLILRGVNPHALPEGFYKVRVQIEKVKSAGGWMPANVPPSQIDGMAGADWVQNDAHH
jgi:hypothetical protein